MNEFQKKLQSLSFARRRGGDNVKRKINEDNGKVAGFEVEHWDDSQDAYARPATVKYKMGGGTNE